MVKLVELLIGKSGGEGLVHMHELEEGLVIEVKDEIVWADDSENKFGSGPSSSGGWIHTPQRPHSQFLSCGSNKTV